MDGKNESNKGYDAIHGSETELMPPSTLLPPPILPPMHRSDLPEDDNIKCCRICLEDDEPHSMIAPCLCKGSQKWVHRTCLDLWRQNEQDRAFSRCTECQYQYHFEQEQSHSVFWRRAKFCLFVSRDLCLMTVLLQLVIGLLGWITHLVDRGSTLPELLDGSATCNASDGDLWCNHKLTVYYMFGVLELFVVMGLVGSVVLCCNGCRIPDWSSSEENNDTPRPERTTRESLLEQGRAMDRNDSVQRRRRASYYRRRRSRNDNCFCMDCGPYYYYGGDCGDCCCCCCYSDGRDSCCCDGSNDCGDGSGCPMSGGGASSSSDGPNDCAHVLVVILLVVVVVMAVVGFFVGLFLATVLVQRVIQNHLFLLQKKQLVEEFRVKDLSSYNLDPEAPSSIYQAPPLLPPKIHPDDEAHLKKLGLLTDNEDG